MTVAASNDETAAGGTITDLDRLGFDNRFVRELPADPDPENRRRQVYGAAYSLVTPTPVAAPHTLVWSPEVAAQLGLAPELCESQDFAEVFSGNRVPAGAEPFAQAYAGHQFGSWAGQLGDGRAIGLGEVVDISGRHQTLQLKGAGPTPYSRTADGRAVLRSSLREYVCSEAMAHLGIPTTRALSLVVTGETVVRDMLYDGNPRPEPGAVVCRVAPSFARFGTFQLAASRNEIDLLRQLVEFTVRNDFPELAEDWGATPEQYVPALLAEVCDRTASLVVDWMRVGFVHGVLNTDNMSILGLTIDYGPYGWLEDFDPGWTPNTTDAGMRRYRFGAQPQVVHWNLLQLANALANLVDDPGSLQDAIDGYARSYNDRFRTMTVARLGWGEPTDGDDALLDGLWSVLVSAEIDQVRFHRDLADVPVDPAVTDDELLAPLAAAWYQPEQLTGDVRSALVTWLRDWAGRAAASGLGEGERRAAMDRLNPLYVPRNYLAQQAIDAAEQGDLAELHELLEVLRRPYDDQPGKERFAERRPDWARTRVGCSQLSCSS
ncbi:protein adenylyltransferase SelO [Rhabdothermincola salaria]|uniref:protein adenylyltransferase SelO n=1 Tax=Rhabdothermincola salaria TaxID=2903142 RepID=UPI001E36DA15|nr:YdiU family protein [Rhabdothermincola salaria]MCD9624752.1 YdiU family protein [Rhabdothermincola salaria]